MSCPVLPCPVSSCPTNYYYYIPVPVREQQLPSPPARGKTRPDQAESGKGSCGSSVLYVLSYVYTLITSPLPFHHTLSVPVPANQLPCSRVLRRRDTARCGVVCLTNLPGRRCGIYRAGEYCAVVLYSMDRQTIFNAAAADVRDG